MKRQRGRNRGGGPVGGKPQQQNANRAFDSTGPEGIKVRGNAQHVFEKYQQLARDAGSGGDRVLAENFLQHAEHYFRVVRAMQPTRPASEILGRDQFSSGFDIDFEDESGAQAAAAADAEAAENEAAAAAEGDGEVRNGWTDRNENRDRNESRDRPREDRPRDDRPREARDDRPRDDRPQNRYRDDRPRDDRPRDDRPRDERPRDDRPRDERPRDDRPRDERPRDERPRDERPREDRPRSFENGGRRDRWRDREDRPERVERDPMAVVEPQATPFTAPSPVAREPVVREPVATPDPITSHAPAFLKSTPRVRPQSAPIPAAEEAPVEAAAKPVRRRAPRAAKTTEAEEA